MPTACYINNDVKMNKLCNLQRRYRPLARIEAKYHHHNNAYQEKPGILCEARPLWYYMMQENGIFMIFIAVNIAIFQSIANENARQPKRNLPA